MEFGQNTPDQITISNKKSLCADGKTYDGLNCDHMKENDEVNFLHRFDTTNDFNYIAHRNQQYVLENIWTSLST